MIYLIRGIKVSVLVLAGMLLLLSPALGEEEFDRYLYWGFVEDTFTAAWDYVPEPDLDRYDIQVYNKEKDEIVIIGSTTPPTAEVTVVFPRSGHYEVQIRACSTTECGPWYSSTGPNGTVGGNPRPWWVYRQISPPGPIEF